MYIAAFVFAPLPAPEPAPGSDFSPLPLDLTAVGPPRSRRKLPNFPVWLRHLLQKLQWLGGTVRFYPLMFTFF